MITHSLSWCWLGFLPLSFSIIEWYVICRSEMFFVTYTQRYYRVKVFVYAYFRSKLNDQYLIRNKVVKYITGDVKISKVRLAPNTHFRSRRVGQRPMSIFCIRSSISISYSKFRDIANIFFFVMLFGIKILSLIKTKSYYIR